MTSAEAVQKRNHIFAVIAATVLALGLLRAVLLVTHSPVFGYALPAAASDGTHVMGIIALALIGGVAAVTALALRSHPVASIVHALLFFLIVADPIGTLWLNSSSPERWALLGAYAVASMAGVLALGSTSVVHWIVLIAGLVAIACGPPMLAGLPLVLVLVTAALLFRRSRTRAWIALAAGLVLAVVGSFTFEMGEYPARAAPAAAPLLAPAKGAGEHAALRPGRALRVIARNLGAAVAMAPASLEASSSSKVRRLVDLPPRVMSFTGLVSTMPATSAAFIGMFMILTMPFAIFWLVWVLRRGPPEGPAIPALYVVLTTILAYCAIAAAFIGPADVVRAQWLGTLAMIGAVVLLPFVAWHLARDLWAGRVAVVVLFGIILLAGGWFASSRTGSLAMGGVERITPGPDRTLQVSGWAIDPRGLKRVFATVGGGPATEATLGTERRDLQAAYPGYPDVLTGGFQMTIASNAWRENQELRVFVENRLGAVTEIDRRDVRLAP